MPDRTIPTFYPPRESLAWFHGAWPIFRLFVHYAGTARFELPPPDAERLRAYFPHAALICPNHPTPAEGPLLFLVGHRLGLRYMHCAALEIYAKFGPLGPHLFPGTGCFSIRRRVVDYPAYNAARTLLAARRNIVLFPEGEISGISDRMLPIERGAVQIAFWGLDELHAAYGPAEPLLLVPVAIKYREVGDAAGAVRASLARLEAALGLPAPEPGRGGLWRLHRIEDAYLAGLEAELGIESAGGGNARWDNVLHALARRAAAGLGVPVPSPDLTRPQRAREMLNAWDAAWLAHGPRGPRRSSPEWSRLQTLHRDVARLNRFMGFEECYVREWPSVERFGDVLRRIEDQVLGRHRWARRRVARLRVGEPIDLAPLRSAYRRDKKGTVAAVMGTLETRISDLLDGLVRELTVPWEGARDDAASREAR